MPVLAAALGEPFQVDLGSAPGSSGYEWQLPALPEGVKLSGSEFTIARGAQPGEGGTQVFHLVAERAGHYTLHFVLKRRWESLPVQTRDVEVEAR